MIFDKNDDLGAAGIIEMLPILLEHHEKTSKVDYSELIIVVSSPYNGENNVNINKSIEVKFNKDIFFYWLLIKRPIIYHMNRF